MVGKNRGSISGAETNQTREAIEQIFNHHCGLITLELLPPVREDWMNRYEPRLATLKKYVDALAALIPDSETRNRFRTDASRRMINRSS